MSRFCRCLVVLVSLAAYFIANTNASATIQSFVRSHVVEAEKVANHSTQEAPAEAPKKKCKHCNPSAETPETTSNSQSPCPPANCPNENHDDPACPCCPHDSDHKNCPCPGGCALCSVAKTPLVVSVNFDSCQSLCVGSCLLIDSSQYASPKCDGLDRPPRA